jgi:hypothetical protein
MRTIEKVRWVGEGRQLRISRLEPQPVNPLRLPRRGELKTRRYCSRLFPFAGWTRLESAKFFNFLRVLYQKIRSSGRTKDSQFQSSCVPNCSVSVLVERWFRLFCARRSPVTYERRNVANAGIPSTMGRMYRHYR